MTSARKIKGLIHHLAKEKVIHTPLRNDMMER